MIWAIVPAKLGDNSKERLASVLAPELRRRLAHAMLDDVLAALAGTRGLAAVLVVSRDAPALALARAHQMSTFTESGVGGLNGAVGEAIGVCSAKGASGILVVMGDLPLLEAEDGEAALAALPPRGIVLVPSFDGTGTNLLAARPADLVRTAFGPASLARHLQRARANHVTTIVCRRAGAALDVDTPDDLSRLMATGPPTTASQRLLASSATRASASG